MILIYYHSPTEDHWHGKIDDGQFYENGINIFKGMQSSAPEGVQVKYMTGFDINGMDENMDQVIETAKDFDAVVVCVGEHVYSECKYKCSSNRPYLNIICY